MKHSYKTLISSIALGSALAFAQAVQPAEPVPAAEAPQAQAAQEAPAQAPTEAPAPESTQAAAAQPATDSTVAKADTTAAAQPAIDSTAAKADTTAAAPVAADSTVAAVDSAAAPATDTTAAKVDSAATQTVAANADSAVAGFVADTTMPPPSPLTGTEISGAIHGFLKTNTGTIQKANNRSPHLQRHIVHAQNFLCMHFTNGSAQYGCVLTKYEYQVTVNQAMTKDRKSVV